MKGLQVPAVLVLIAVASVIASAQEAVSFEQLQTVIEPDDEVRVVAAGGVSSRGRITGISSTALELSVDGMTRRFTPSDIAEIRKRGDPIRDGAFRGALIGLGVGGAAVAVGCFSGYCREGAIAMVGTTLYGTGIGLGVDALVRGEQTIYRAPAVTAVRGVRVSPVLGPGARGVRVSIGF